MEDDASSLSGESDEGNQDFFSETEEHFQLQDFYMGSKCSFSDTYDDLAETDVFAAKAAVVVK